MPLPRSLANIKREISEKKWEVGRTTKRSTCQKYSSDRVCRNSVA